MKSYKEKYKRLLKKHRAYKDKIESGVALASSDGVFARMVGFEQLGIPIHGGKYEWYERDFAVNQKS